VLDAQSMSEAPRPQGEVQLQLLSSEDTNSDIARQSGGPVPSEPNPQADTFELLQSKAFQADLPLHERKLAAKRLLGESLTMLDMLHMMPKHEEVKQQMLEITCLGQIASTIAFLQNADDDQRNSGADNTIMDPAEASDLIAANLTNPAFGTMAMQEVKEKDRDLAAASSGNRGMISVLAGPASNSNRTYVPNRCGKLKKVLQEVKEKDQQKASLGSLCWEAFVAGKDQEEDGVSDMELMDDRQITESTVAEGGMSRQQTADYSTTTYTTGVARTIDSLPDVASRRAEQQPEPAQDASPPSVGGLVESSLCGIFHASNAMGLRLSVKGTFLEFECIDDRQCSSIKRRSSTPPR